MRKQRKAAVDDEEGEGGENTQGDEFANLKVTSQGIVDFSSLGPNDVFPPTADTKNVWSIMVSRNTSTHMFVYIYIYIYIYTCIWMHTHVNAHLQPERNT